MKGFILLAAVALIAVTVRGDDNNGPVIGVGPLRFLVQKAAVLNLFNAIDSFNGTRVASLFTTTGSLTFDSFGTQVGKTAIAGLINSFQGYPQPRIVTLSHVNLQWYSVDDQTIIIEQTENRAIKTPAGNILNLQFPSMAKVTFENGLSSKIQEFLSYGNNTPNLIAFGTCLKNSDLYAEVAYNCPDKLCIRNNIWYLVLITLQFI
jgi:hypothetical protein